MFSDAIEALEHIYEVIVGLPETLVSVLVSIVYLVLYPIVCMVSVVYGWIMGLLGPCIDVMGILYDLGTGTLSSVVDVFSSALPSSWIVLLGTIVTLNVAIRVYYLLKGVSIFGWSL